MMFKNYENKKLYIEFENKGCYPDNLEMAALLYPQGVDIAMGAVVAFGKMRELHEDIRRTPLDIFWKIVEHMFEEENNKAIENFKEPKYSRGGYKVPGPMVSFETIVNHVIKSKEVTNAGSGS